jgi:hypothetical protein
MDLDIAMTFPVGSTFVFSSCIYMKDDNSKLHSHLVDDPANQASPMTHQDPLENLTKNFSEILISDPTQSQYQFKQFKSYSDMTRVSESASKPSDIPLGLKNTASTYQAVIRKIMSSPPIWRQIKKSL